MKITYARPSLKCGAYWNAADAGCALGDTIDVPETTANRLLATGYWDRIPEIPVQEEVSIPASEIKVETAEIAQAPADKMIRKQNNVLTKKWGRK